MITTVQIASIPSRVESLQKTVESVLPQVTFMFVALNGYQSIPSFLWDNRRISTTLMDNRYGDAAKFYNIEEREGYLFTLDDDIVVKPTYIADMCDAIDKYKCIVTLHGRTWRRPFESYYKLQSNHRCLGNVLKPAYVDAGGTGVMGWHSSILKIKFEDFPKPNMADIWMAKLAYEQKVPIMVIPHTANYLQHTRHSTDIFTERYKDRHKDEEEILKTFIV